MTVNEFKYSLDLLKRINRISVNGERLSERKILGKYNIWIFFQNSLFFNEIKAFREGKISKRIEGNILQSFKEFLLRLLALGATMVSLTWAVLRGVEIMVYSIDRTSSVFSGSDGRMDPIYEALLKNRIKFLECFHTIFGGIFIRNLLMRRRLALYQKSLDLLCPTFDFLGLIQKREPIDWLKVDLSDFSEEEKIFAREMVEKYLGLISVMKFRVNVFQKIFKLLRVKAVFAIDDPRDYNDVVLAASLSKVPIYAFQHGHFTKYHVGWLSDGTFTGEIARPNRIYVWSKFWKNELLRLGTYFKDEEIMVGGPKTQEPLELGESSVPMITVVIPFEVDSDKGQVKKYIEEILLSDDTHVLFKLRSDLDVGWQLSISLLDGYKHPRFSTTTNTQEAITKATIFAGTYSTFLYDMVATGKPVAYLESSSDFGEGLIINRLADKVSLGNVAPALRTIAGTPREILMERKRALYGEGLEPMTRTVEKLLFTLKL